ncbi:hypothetical protein RAA17_00430 [Komagataeibacter rhaeticus]|nr:hypothetical protein [Komagataeibacter rhaeticus]
MTDASRIIPARIGDDLPRIDVIGLANTRRIMHAERHNDGGRMPMFIPTAAWTALLERHCMGKPRPPGPGWPRRASWRGWSAPLAGS